MTAWLITGGAGYIGAHVVRAFLHAGMTPIVFDNLSSGRLSFVPPSVKVIRADILDTHAVEAALRESGCVGVVHLAGFKYAGESVSSPLHTYQQNVMGTASLLQAMDSAGVRFLVFSSSAGVYGTPPVEIVTESTPTDPESPYGESKLVGEWLIRAQVSATAGKDAALAATSLRYFNVAGSGTHDVWDTSPHNLLPRVFATLARGESPHINGSDYPTPDGTCIRDYVHVVDVASVHVAAAKALSSGRRLEQVYNLGSGKGTSVAEVIDAVKRVTGIPFTPHDAPRRQGDPSRIVANGDLAARDLGWANTYSITDMVRSAWESAPRPDPLSPGAPTKR